MRFFNRTFRVVAMSALVAAVFSCGEVVTPDDFGDVEVSISFAPSSTFSEIADSAEAVASASDIDTVVVELTITDSKVTGLVNLPAGSDRHIVVNVYDDSGTLQYTGEAYVDVVANSTCSHMRMAGTNDCEFRIATTNSGSMKRNLEMPERIPNR